MIQGSLSNENIGVAESTRHTWDEEEKRLARDYDLQVRKLELDVIKRENSLSVWFKIPLSIIKLPIWLLLGIGYIIAMIRKYEPSDKFWDYLK